MNLIAIKPQSYGVLALRDDPQHFGLCKGCDVKYERKAASPVGKRPNPAWGMCSVLYSNFRFG